MISEKLKCINSLSIIGLIIFLIIVKPEIGKSQIAFYTTKTVVGFNPEKYYGIQFGIYNSTFLGKGIQLGIINKGFIDGFRVGILNTQSIRGLQFGLINFKSDIRGGSLGLINISETVKGFQIGAFNSHYGAMRNNCSEGYRDRFDYTWECQGCFGLQIGLINRQIYEKGLQIGIINIRPMNRWFAKVLPIINFKIEKKE